MTPLRNILARLRDTLRVSGPLWLASLTLDRAGVGTLGLWKEKTVLPEALQRQISAILGAWGMPEEQAAVTTRHILYADLHGIDSHGCSMLLKYHRDLLSGVLNIAPRIEVVREGPSTALVDGGGGLGHVPADTAMRLAIAKCRESGAAAVAVRNSGHFGAAGTYASMAAEAGIIGLATTDTPHSAVVPTFGIEGAFGTNPIAFAAPAVRNRPFLLDMATSTVAINKIMDAWRRGRSIPAGWAINPSGMPETRPRRAVSGRRLTPLGGSRELGGHKGYGLNAMVEILSAILPARRTKKSPFSRSTLTGHFFLALDPGRFREDGGFESDLDAMMDDLRSIKPLDPAKPVLVAGDPEYAAQAERNRAGIPLPRVVVEDIRLICHASGAPFLLEEGADRP